MTLPDCSNYTGARCGAHCGHGKYPAGQDPPQVLQGIPGSRPGPRSRAGPRPSVPPRFEISKGWRVLRIRWGSHVAGFVSVWRVAVRGNHVGRPEHAAQASRLGRVDGLRVSPQSLGVAQAAAPSGVQARRVPHHMTFVRRLAVRCLPRQATLSSSRSAAPAAGAVL